MRKRILTALLVVVVAVALVVGGFFFGFRAGRILPENVTVHGVNNIENGEPTSIDFAYFWRAWKVIEDNYLRNDKVASQDKVYGAINGLVNSLKDPYSEFFSPRENQKFQDDIRGNFGGIGAELGMKDHQLVVIAPLKDTPASRADLRAGDQILAINSSSTEGIAVDGAVNLIRGPEGAAVTLTIMRDKWEKPKDFKITRETIVVPTLDSETVGGNLAHISLHSFNSNVGILFYKAMFGALTKENQGLILDLRDDPGGYLEVAVDLAGWFLPRGKLVVSEIGRNGPAQEFRAGGNAALADFPVAVLINGGSASASEILAGALRDQRGIKLIGENSFGKGTVQQLEDLGDGSSIKLTVAHWVLPLGHILENGGLKPDYEVKMTDEDRTNKRDPQLQKAIEVLKEQIANSQ